MCSRYSITYKGPYVRVESIGQKTSEFSRSLWQDISKVCEANQCFHVMGIAYSSNAVSEMDAFKLADSMREVMHQNTYRLAWVELNSAQIERTKHAETVLRNRGLPGRLFENEDDAIKWLLNSEAHPSQPQTS